MLEQEPHPQGSALIRDPEEPLRLAAFLRSHRSTILADWQRSTHTLHSSRTGQAVPLTDHIPALLDGITEALAHTVHGVPLHLPGILSDVHALARLDQGFNIHELAYEYGLLRRCILYCLEGQGARPGPGVLALLDEILDQGVSRAMLSYTRLRERTLNALDGMMQAALDSPDEETLLNRLLTLLMEASLRVDSVAILLCGGDGLQVRAAMGLGAEQSRGLRLRIGEGFAGRVAAERHPLAVRSAVTEVRDEALRPLGLRALYGVPLLDGERLVGVAYMGSRTVYAFSEADTLLFRTMVVRATALIIQAQLRAQEQAARQEAQRSLAMIDALLDTSPVGIAFLDRELRYLRINETLAALNARPMQEHLGRTVREVLAPAVADLVEATLRQVLETGEPARDLELTPPPDRNGPQERTWLASYFPVRTAAGELLGIGAIVMDISARKQAERALEKAVCFREQLLAVLGHDLRNPLSAINASTFLLSRAEGLEPRERQAVERIRRSGARMGRLIDDILDFARSRLGGGIPVTRQRMNMGEVCRTALEELQAAFPDRQLLFEARGDTWGEWDPDRVAQVLGNLVFNALQHGRVNQPVRTTVRGTGTHVLLEVWNQGEPIPAGLLPRLFDPFKRGPEDQRPREGRGGTRSLGLGLHIVRQIAQAHGGEVEVSSTAQEGTRFTVCWPRASG